MRYKNHIVIGSLLAAIAALLPIAVRGQNPAVLFGSNSGTLVPLSVNSSGHVATSQQSGNATLGATGTITWTGRSIISSPADSYILFTENDADGFTGLRLGGSTTSYPGLFRNATSTNALDVRLADNSAQAGLTASAITAGTTTAASAGQVRATATSITSGSGTGVTVNNSGLLMTGVYKVTILSTQFITNGTTHDVTIGTLPAKTFLVGVVADVTTTFACTAVCTTATLSMTLGKSAGANEYLLSFDADAAAAQFGDAAAELGASLTPATIQTAFGDLGSWASTQIVTLRLTSAVGNLGDGAVTNLSQGSITLYLITTRLP